ncbi:hypothetical protein BHM03_00032753 [Ensete ventricosum]|nr:hypothetical protein BHM03_00032753 [Ensete ventricosum]
MEGDPVGPTRRTRRIGWRADEGSFSSHGPRAPRAPLLSFSSSSPPPRLPPVENVTPAVLRFLLPCRRFEKDCGDRTRWGSVAIPSSGSRWAAATTRKAAARTSSASLRGSAAIISMARREMDDMMTKKNQQQQPTAPPPPEAVPQILNPGLSMKRSLQRFLQKRKARISDVSPYTQTRKLFFPIESQQA